MTALKVVLTAFVGGAVTFLVFLGVVVLTLAALVDGEDWDDDKGKGE